MELLAGLLVGWLLTHVYHRWIMGLFMKALKQDTLVLIMRDLRKAVHD